MSLRSDFEIARNDASFGRRWALPIAVSLALIALTIAALRLIEIRFQQDHLICLYVVPTLLIALRFGRVSAICVAIVSAFAAAYFLCAPYLSLAVADPLELIELILFGVLALLASLVVAGFGSGATPADQHSRIARPQPGRRNRS